MKPDILLRIAESKDLTTYHYKTIIFLMGEKEATQSQMAKFFGIPKQNINKVCKELNSMNIVTVKRKEGRNIFWALNPNPIFQTKGQLKLDDLL